MAASGSSALLTAARRGTPPSHGYPHAAALGGHVRGCAPTCAAHAPPAMTSALRPHLSEAAAQRHRTAVPSPPLPHTASGSAPRRGPAAPLRAALRCGSGTSAPLRSAPPRALLGPALRRGRAARGAEAVAERGREGRKEGRKEGGGFTPLSSPGAGQSRRRCAQARPAPRPARRRSSSAAVRGEGVRAAPRLAPGAPSFLHPSIPPPHGAVAARGAALAGRGAAWPAGSAAAAPLLARAAAVVAAAEGGERRRRGWGRRAARVGRRKAAVMAGPAAP